MISKRQLSSQAGVTLIELTIAISISSIIILALSDLLMNSYKSMNDLQQQVDFAGFVAVVREALTYSNAQGTTCDASLGIPASPPAPPGTAITLPTINTVPLGTGTAGLDYAQVPVIYSRATVTGDRYGGYVVTNSTPLVTWNGNYGEFSSVQLNLYNMGPIGWNTYLAGLYIQGTRPSSYAGSSTLKAMVYVAVAVPNNGQPLPQPIISCQQTWYRTGAFGASGPAVTGSWTGEFYDASANGGPYTPGPGAVHIFFGGGPGSGPGGLGTNPDGASPLPVSFIPVTSDFYTDSQSWAQILVNQW
jgi:prepilin-type N-terminal cleavage/methylation domain-containing protein